MSWATCYSGSNNIHFNSPPIMSDGRNFATWVPACAVNETIQQKTSNKRQDNTTYNNKNDETTNTHPRPHKLNTIRTQILHNNQHNCKDHHKNTHNDQKSHLEYNSKWNIT